jgi:dihydrofolate synthase/folylpolyglutamate synthase
MNYDQTTEYLFTQLPMFSRVGAAAYKADLTNTIKLLFYKRPDLKQGYTHLHIL